MSGEKKLKNYHFSLPLKVDLGPKQVELFQRFACRMIQVFLCFHFMWTQVYLQNNYNIFHAERFQ